MTYEIKYRSEDEMKDSGIEWLGMIPREWGIIKNKYISAINTGSRDTQDSVNNGLYPFYVRSKDIERINSYSFDGEAILTPGDGDIGGVFHYINGKFDYHQRVYKYSNFKNYNGKYLYYYLMSFLKRKVIGLSAKSTVDSLRLPMLLNFECILNDVSEQQKIANFLDIKTAQFDSIISKKEKLIEKLKEAKKSLISEVVTGKVKIVNGKLVKRQPEEMKDSGVKWLGMIPKEWEVKKIKYVSDCYPSNVDKKTHIGEKPVKLCNYTDVYYNDYITDKLDFMNATATNAQIIKFGLKKGDIVLTKDSETPDDIAIASYVNESIQNLVCGYHLTIIKVFEQYNSLYVYFQLLSTGIRNYFEIIANGVTRYGIGINGFKNLSICLPTIGEQKVISNYIAELLGKVKNIISKTQLQIEKLKSAKQSLISEAVTGKIDLRDWEIVEEGGTSL